MNKLIHQQNLSTIQGELIELQKELQSPLSIWNPAHVSNVNTLIAGAIKAIEEDASLSTEQIRFILTSQITVTLTNSPGEIKLWLQEKLQLVEAYRLNLSTIDSKAINVSGANLVQVGESNQVFFVNASTTGTIPRIDKSTDHTVRQALFHLAKTRNQFCIDWAPDLVNLPDSRATLLELDRIGLIAIRKALGKPLGVGATLSPAFILAEFKIETHADIGILLGKLLAHVKHESENSNAMQGSSQLSAQLQLPEIVVKACLESLALHDHIRLMHHGREYLVSTL